jgi:uncharacterized damage-inducible protein DinB
MMTSFALAFLALPLGTLAAQQPSAPPAPNPAAAANPITTLLRNRTIAYQRQLAQAFDSIPERIYGYSPTPAQQTIGYVAQHLANDNFLFCRRFGAMQGTRAAADTTTADSVKAKWPREQLNAKLKESFKFCEDAYAQLNDANLLEATTISFGGQSRPTTRLAMALGHITDMAEHYSQIANYMRLNNILPPTALPRPRPGS